MIELRKVGHSWDDGQTSWAVKDVSFEVERGEFVVLLGESGSGKTTTLKMINRLVDPTEGEVYVDGVNVRSRSPIQLRRGIGYTTQGIGLFPHMTVEQNIAAVPSLLGWSALEKSDRVRELLAMMGLDAETFSGRYPSELSGGQAQRVGFARALAARPSILLLDEPFGALDPLIRDELQGELSRLHRELNLTTVMVTHDMTEALLMADRIAVFRQGHVVQLDTPARLMQHPADEYVASLMSTPKRQADRLETLASGPES